MKEKKPNQVCEMTVLCICYGQVVLVAVGSEKFRFRRNTLWLRKLPMELDGGQAEQEKLWHTRKQSRENGNGNE